VSIKFGLALDFWSPTKPLNTVLDDYASLLTVAEKYGFDSVWAGENRPFKPETGHVPSPLLVLAALAGRTSLRLATGITLLPVWQPLRLAYDGAILDQLSQGRFILGVGTGNPHTLKRYGVPPEETASRMDEALVLLKHAWSGADGFDGDHFPYEGIVYPGPVQDGGPPILVGGMIPRAVRRATDMADGWIAATQFHRNLVKLQADRYYQRLESQGKDLSKGIVAINRTCVVAESDSVARKEGKEYVSNVLNFYGRMGLITDNEGNALDPKDDLFEQVGSELYFVGSPATCIESIQTYEAIGVNQINFRVTMGDMPIELAERTVELLGREVIPQFI
jgi:alkanesulfonate monooxygenase SsuD/methylene tetrahydromethanopterin reductase-like flavin-dependent oxidoreductase (luciferase family)